MFQHNLWRMLPRERVGVTVLRERLQALLGQITDQVFPSLSLQHFPCAKKLRRPRRPETISKNRTRAGNVSQLITGKFLQFVRGALGANYSYDTAFENGEFRLIPAVLNLPSSSNTIPIALTSLLVQTWPS